MKNKKLTKQTVDHEEKIKIEKMKRVSTKNIVCNKIYFYQFFKINN